MVKQTIRPLLSLALFLLVSGGLAAQSTLSIVDVLPPYNLSATLLSNGHFSVTTTYTGEVKTLIYQEDGSGGRPVNYTSHVHIKVDDIIFQLPYELNPVTRQTPPANPLTVENIYRDTVAGTPRVNGAMFGVMPDGDTVRCRLWMEPVKRPSGGFIRISVEAINTTSRPRDVGVLMLIDTKIGDNDRAPIISAFGYETKETEFESLVNPGMPPFWLGLEGSPVAPGLTARGNLSAEGLVLPDYFLFGNWKDNTAVNAVGLALAEWDERRAVDQGYTDSSILLLWQQKSMARGERRTVASTEIGLVDSLAVGFGGGIGLAGGGIGGGGGGGGGGGCLAFDTLSQTNCADPDFRPYAPDTLQALFLVTNQTAPQLDNTTVEVENLPAGLLSPSPTSPVTPGTLTADITGVATLNFVAETRLYDTIYRVPLLVKANGGTEILRDTLCIFVPGAYGEILLEPTTLLPLCPNLVDTIVVPATQLGNLCVDLLPNPVLIPAPGAPAGDVAQFSILPGGPVQLPANGTVGIPISYSSTATGTSHRARLVVSGTMRGLDRDDQPGTRVISDTIELLGEGREAEFTFAGQDTLDFGAICVGDTLLQELTITNLGGCDLTLDGSSSIENDPGSAFSVANATSFPLLVPRSLDGTVLIRFNPTVGGVVEARLLVRSSALPFVDTVILRGTGDLPRYLVEVPDEIDTLCPDAPLRLSIPVENPTACPVTIESISVDDLDLAVDSPNGFTIPPLSRRTLLLSGSKAAPGDYLVGVTFRSAAGGDTTASFTLTVASRALTSPAMLDFGDVRVGVTSAPQVLSLLSSGTAGVEIRSIRLAGAERSEYTLTLPAGTTLPLRLEPGEQLDLTLEVEPGAIELRRATLLVETTAGTICVAPDPIELSVRGVLPILDIPERRLLLERICVTAEPLDTVISLRNRGNAPLTVQRGDLISVTGEVSVQLAGLPVTIEPDSTGTLPLTVSPGSLGPFVADLRFTTNGEPLVPSDTTFRVEGSGIICATVWIDTVRSVIGAPAEPAIMIDAGELGVAEVSRLMREAGVESTALTVGYDQTIFRPDPNAGTTGMFSGPGLARNLDPASGTMAITFDPALGPLSGNGGADDNLLLMIPGDILLGQADRTPLRLGVESFADGFARLEVLDGLLIAEYCAIDRRYVALARPFIRSVTTPTSAGEALQLWLPERADVRVRLYSATGAEVATLVSAPLPEGTHYTLLPSDLPPGIYLAELVSGQERREVRILVE